MHAKPDLRVVLKWMIYRSGSVIAAVITLLAKMNPYESPKSSAGLADRPSKSSFGVARPIFRVLAGIVATWLLWHSVDDVLCVWSTEFLWNLLPSIILGFLFAAYLARIAITGRWPFRGQ